MTQDCEDEGGTESKAESRGREIVFRLRGSGTADLEMTTDEIIDLMRGEVSP